MKTATERTQEAIATLRANGVNFRQIVEALHAAGHTTSISHLSRIMDDQREASPALALAAERVAGE
jgi:hypothetical protein